MLFALSKAGWFLATPSNLLVVLTLLGALWGRARWGRRLAAGGLAAMLVLGLAPVGAWMLALLENRFPAYADDRGETPCGVIVLGGAVHASTTLARGQITVGDAGERIIALADLARRYPGTRIIFTGGSGVFFNNEPPEADMVERFASTLGLAPGRVMYERRSRTTAENAAETRRLVAPGTGERWLLVTSAWHMPRAIGAFRGAGFDVIAYPVDYRTGAPHDVTMLEQSVATGLERFDLAVREWLGLLVYRLTGRSDVLLPAP